MKECVFELIHGADNPRNSEGAFLLTEDGRIRFIYTRYSGTSWGDHASADLAEAVSEDGGTTWKDCRVVISRGDAANIMSVSLLRLQDGSVRLFYLEKRALSGGCMSCIPMMRRSDDEGESWSEAKRLIPHDGYFVMNNDRAIQLSSGRILLPLSFHPWRTGGGLRPGTVFVLFSDDNGETWTESQTMLTPDFQTETRAGFQEPGVIELDAGKILLWIRTARGFQFRSVSCDGGNTWSSAVADLNFPSPCSPMSMKRNPATGTLYAVWNGTNRILYPAQPTTPPERRWCWCAAATTGRPGKPTVRSCWNGNRITDIAIRPCCSAETICCWLTAAGGMETVPVNFRICGSAKFHSRNYGRIESCQRKSSVQR